MIWQGTLRFFLIVMTLLLVSCATSSSRNTLASLNDIEFEVKDEEIDGSLEKALQSYENFLRQTPESAMTPEALRRLADLKIQKEYEVQSTSASQIIKPKTAITEANNHADLPQLPDANVLITAANLKNETLNVVKNPIADLGESEKDFQKRASKKIDLDKTDTPKLALPEADADDLQAAGAKEAIELYKGLLRKYPLFERNDQVLYQLSRAYEETGQIEIAMTTLQQLINKYPRSRHIEESWFRRAEYFFVRKKYLDAEELYQSLINVGEASEFYELALYKQGWAYFKQDMYEEALQNYLKLLDYKIANGYDLENIKNKLESKYIEDTYRVISLSFSYLGGADAVLDYFNKHGHRFYEASIYSHLGEYFLIKRRYSDAAKSYETFTKYNPQAKESVYFDIRVIDIYKQGGFPKLVIDGKKEFSKKYGLQSSYWTFFDIHENPEARKFLKSNLVDLANHYHALYQDRRHYRKKQKNYLEAIHWYKEYLLSFPIEKESPMLNNQLADLLLEHKDYFGAATEYERTAYNYPKHDKSSSAGYAAVYAYREYLKVVTQAKRNIIKRETIRSSIKFFEHFPKHKHAARVLVGAVDDLYALEDYEQVVIYGRRAIKQYPKADKKLIRSAWMVVAHASFDITNYKDAEDAYTQTLTLTNKKDKSYIPLTENLAASVYKQGEQARQLEDYQLAAKHFLRVAKVTPFSKIRPTAEYDAAAAFIMLKQWASVALVLEDFRVRYPKHKFQHDISKKLAVAYKEDGLYLKSAVEFERIEKENPKDDDLRREALNQAASLYEKIAANDKALLVYKKLVRYFPKPIDGAIETRYKIANIYLSQNKQKTYINELKRIIAIDASGGKGRTDRTRYLAASASLILVKPLLQEFKKIALAKPFKRNLQKKKKKMRKAIDAYTKLIDYQVGDVTAAATFYIAEIYFEFSNALIKSERPTNLNDEELEQYELVIEEQAYPFEEKAINVHEKNMELLDVNIYNQWIDKSIAKLAVLLPARYAKTEQSSAIIVSIKPTSDSGYNLAKQTTKAKNDESDPIFVATASGS